MKITDKMLHFGISFLIVSTVFLYCNLFGLSLVWSCVLSNVVAISFGVVKEIIDLKWDWKDILADVAGVVAGDVIIGIILLIK